MIQIQDLTKTEKLSRNDLQTIQGGIFSRFTFSYASSWGAIAPSAIVEPGPVPPVPIPYPNTTFAPKLH